MYAWGVVLVCLAAVNCASLEREKRQATGCDDNIPNPCGTTTTTLYFPHPTDNTRFLQCADGGRMFIIKCPAGETYSQATMRCARPQVVTAPPTQAPNPNPGVTIANPCTPAVLASGKIFFQTAPNSAKFIECTPDGKYLMLTCPSRLVFSPVKQGCVLPSGTQTGTGAGTGSGTGSSTVVQTGTAGGPNPCTAAAVASNQLFFPFSPDKTKYIHCDLAGDPYIMQCPANLVWNQPTTTCESAFALSSGQPTVG